MMQYNKKSTAALGEEYGASISLVGAKEKSLNKADNTVIVDIFQDNWQKLSDIIDNFALQPTYTNEVCNAE